MEDPVTISKEMIEEILEELRYKEEFRGMNLLTTQHSVNALVLKKILKMLLETGAVPE